MNTTAKILTSISATEPSTFREFCGALGDEKPEKGDREGWADIFKILESLQRDGLVEIERSDNAIDSLMLTELGAERAREALRAR